ncbi:hypothetical protein M316_0032 [Nitrincola phage 1M3-16]|uniref:hypothetical protein n=1 Tax=Nitrincola phage 1M3-16 TaxID=1472912 RepID=UPI000444E895|nr:hypothetical protein GJ22_gp120 [Nitrincola phage 1M3-16]AHX01097.1 hypothetical protein M316_0032 [Nitrincola phage 1M3-16]
MKPEELRREYAGRDVDGDLGWTMHVSTVANLLKEKDQQIKKLKEDNEKLKLDLKEAYTCLNLKYIPPKGVIGYARKEDIDTLLNDGSSHFHIGLDHPSLWQDEAPYPWLVAVCLVDSIIEHDAQVIEQFSDDLSNITNEMKSHCMGEFSWEEYSPCYDENGEIFDQEVTRTVPWDLCKKIYKELLSVKLGQRDD